MSILSASDLTGVLAFCGAVIVVMIACLIARRTSLRSSGGAARTAGSAILIVVGVGVLYPGVLVIHPQHMFAADQALAPLLALLICVVGVATSLVVVQQNEATTLRWPLASLCLGSALTSIYYLGNAAFGRPSGSTPFAILAMLCATTLVAWAMLALAFPRTYLTPRLAFARCVGAAVLLCGGMIVLDVWGADTFAYAERASFIDMAGSVGLLTLVVSVLALLATLLDRHLMLQRADLVASQQLYRSLYDGNPDAVFTLDLDGRFMSVNAATSAVLGQHDEHLLNHPFASFLDASDQKRWLHVLEVVSDGTTRTLSVHLAQTPQRVLVVTHIPLLMDGLVVGMYGIARDVTEDHAATTTLESKEARYRSAFEYAPVGMALVNPDGCYIAVNRALCQLLGYSESELLDMSWLDLTPPDVYEAELAMARQMLQGEVRTYHGILRYRHKQGHTVWAERHISLARDATYEPLYFICEIAESLPPDQPPPDELSILPVENKRIDTCPQDIVISCIDSSFETLGRDVQCAVSLPDWRSGALQVERLLHVLWDRKVWLLVQSLVMHLQFTLIGCLNALLPIITDASTLNYEGRALYTWQDLVSQLCPRWLPISQQSVQT